MRISQVQDFEEGTHVINGVPTLKGFEVIFNNITAVALGFAGIVLFLLLIIGGIKYMTSGGNPEGAQSAQKTITYALIGIVVVILAFLILVFIQTFTGANITRFSINQ